MIAESRRLTKAYMGKKAVKEVSIKICGGSIYGLLGPNGSGKTTWMKMMTGFVKPTQGEVIFDGAPWNYRAKNQVAYMSTEPFYYDFMNIGMVGKYYSDFFEGLIDECNLTQDALSEKVGKKRSSVSNYLRLLKLPDEVQLALKEGLISMGHAKAIAGAPADQQLRVLKRCIKKGLSVRQVEELVRSLSEAPGKEAQNVEDEEYPESYLKLVEQLEKFFSQEISIKRAKNGGGKIVIGFTDDRDIEQFIERFAKRS